MKNTNPDTYKRTKARGDEGGKREERKRGQGGEKRENDGREKGGEKKIRERNGEAVNVEGEGRRD